MKRNTTTNQFYTTVIFTVILYVLSGCSSKLPDYYIEHKGRYDVITITSNSIAKSTLGDIPFQSVDVFLPDSYNKENDAYPVVYYLNGFATPSAYLRLFLSDIKAAIQNSHNEFIIVSIVGINPLDGSFYVNSKISGNWEDYIIQEVIPIVEKEYNVIKEKNGRGIAGHSMGGFGALNIGMKHPELFSAVSAIAPGAYVEEDLQLVLNDWKNYQSPNGNGIIKKAYATALTGNETSPTLDGSDNDKKVIEQWNSGMSNWKEKVNQYRNKKKQVKKFLLICGKEDEHVWIRNATRHISEIFNSNSIANEYYSVNGTHDLNTEMLVNLMVPFFSENLK